MALNSVYRGLWIFLFIFITTLSHGCCIERYYKTDYIDVPLDHYSFTTGKSFKMRYLLNDTYWDKTKGPVLLYTGNEGSIELFAKATGLIWEMAPDLNALIVFAEHRYYGESLPFGNNSYNSTNVGYLTSTQAIADYVDLLSILLKGKNNPVIAIGGSYGGMLAAYIRIKYPHIVTGAIAASAPILQFQGLVDCGIYNKILTSVYNAASRGCVINIRKSWPAIKAKLGTNAGRDWMAKIFKPCKPLTNDTNENYQLFRDWLTDIYSNVAMMNYPYENDFLAPLPAYPVLSMCQYFKNTSLSDEPLLEALYSAISVYTNFTGKSQCNSLDNANSGDIDATGWDYQACSEMVMPMCSNGKDDMFEVQPWSQDEFDKACTKKWKVKPAYDLAIKEYGGSRLRYTSNIIFSNGLLDPWSGGGVLKNYSQLVSAVIIPEGAHHLDLRDSNSRDPYSVKMARQFHKDTIKRWVKDYQNSQNRHNHNL